MWLVIKPRSGTFVMVLTHSYTFWEQHVPSSLYLDHHPMTTSSFCVPMVIASIQGPQKPLLDLLLEDTSWQDRFYTLQLLEYSAAESRGLPAVWLEGD